MSKIIPSTKLKTVSGFPDYEITEDGRVWSKSRKWARRYKQLKSRDNKEHLMVALYRNKERYDVYVHTLVLETFVGSRPEGMECRHLDGNPANNNVNNLCWGTHEENAQDAVRHGTSGGFKVKGEKHGNTTLTEDDVRLMFNAYHDAAYRLYELAKHFNVTIQSVYAIVNKKSWGHLWV